MTETLDVRAPMEHTASPMMRIETNTGTFMAHSARPMISSARKRAWRGVLHTNDGSALDAVAIAFIGSDQARYGSEVAALARNQLLCIGPDVFAFAAHGVVDGTPAPFVIEEDAGTNLEEALFDGIPIAGVDASCTAPLSPVGSPARRLENEKILYDILDQVARMHAHGHYHRDIRAANICVRRFGDRPNQLHATLIDHELVTTYEGRAVPAVAKRYERALFERLPRSCSPNAAPCRPTSLMRDLGYLAALAFELSSGRSVELMGVADIPPIVAPLFSYTTRGTIVMRRIDPSEDLAPLARKLGLAEVSASTFFDPRVLSFVRERVAPGGFIDQRGLMRAAREAHAVDDVSAESLARSVIYPAWVAQCRAQGREPEYASFDEQPELLQASNLDQARDIPAKVRALGYRIVPAADVPEEECVDAFEPEEVEILARLEHVRWIEERLRHGWIYGAVRDDERRIHPDLVPYDELTERSKDYDRQAVVQIPGILAAAGLAICR